MTICTDAGPGKCSDELETTVPRFLKRCNAATWYPKYIHCLTASPSSLVVQMHTKIALSPKLIITPMVWTNFSSVLPSSWPFSYKDHFAQCMSSTRD